MEVTTNTLRLTGENWPVWKFQTTIILKGKGLFDLVNGTRALPTVPGDNLTKWQKDDAKAQEILVTRMDEGPLTHILSCETSKDMWAKLKSVYDKESAVSVHLLQQRFFLLEFDSSVSTFMSKIEEIKNKLKTAGETLSDKMIITKVLMTLPGQYRHFRSAWESVPVENQTLEELTSRLVLEEERAKSQESTTALAANIKQNNLRLRCHVCSKTGHLAKNCYFRNKNKTQKFCTHCKKGGHEIKTCWFKKGHKEENSSKKNEEGKNETNAFMVYMEDLKRQDWCLDSGASEHMCWDKTLFQSINKIKHKKMVQVGNGEKLEVRGVGEIKLWASTNNKQIETTLTHVLYVPGLKFNLFSAGSALDKNFYMISDNKKCEFVDEAGNTRALAIRKNKLFKMLFTTERSTECNTTALLTSQETDSLLEVNDPQNPVSECMKVRSIENIKDWHDKLAHQNIKHVRSFLKTNEIEFVDVEDFMCEQCLSGKQHRQTFQSSDSRATHPLELVHADVCGPMETTSLGGARYFLLFKDDYSSYRFVYFLKQKSEVRKIIEKFISLAERETDHKMKILRTDNGLEFLNNEVKELVESKGIKHQRTVVYTPEQNGRAERDMRTLVEAARTMLNGGLTLEKHFWAEAINTVAYTLNRSGSSPQKLKTPYELWYKKKTTIKHFQTFGTKVSVHVPKEKRLKWDPKNQIGIFLGYGQDVKGYRIYFQNKNKVETHRDVIFIPERNKITEMTEEIIRTEEIEETLNEENEVEQRLEQENEVEQRFEQENVEINELENDDDLDYDVEENNSSDSNDETEGPMYNLRRERRRNPRYDDYEMDMDKIMLTEGPMYNLRRERRRNPRYDDYEMDMDKIMLTTSEIEEDPMCYEEAMTSNDSEKWKEAMKTEINALNENETWVIVKESDVKSRAVQCKWVFKRKRDEQGNVVKYKARLVARGFQQISMDNPDFYSPVAKLTSIRIFLALCNNFNFKIYQLDVCSAFLNGDIDDEVFITFPKGFGQNTGKSAKLRKSLYGLKTSPKNWYKKFNDLMLELNFTRSENEYCIYIKITDISKTFVLIYVDDLLLAGSNELEIKELKQTLNDNFKVNDLGQIRYFLGMLITQNLTENKIIINQTTYLKGILKRFDLEKCKPSNIPMEVNFRHDELKREYSESHEIENKCRRAIGSIMYAMLCSRPDLCISISILSRYQSSASFQLWQAIKRVLRYVQKTLDLSLVFHKNNYGNLLEGYTDSDWAGDRVDRKSTSGYLFKVFGCLVSWSSRKQSTVALSSTEAEYIALSLAVSEACWLRQLIVDLLSVSEKQLSAVIFEDNQSAIKICKNPEFHKRLKHVDIRFHFIREKVKDRVIHLKYVPTNLQIADFLTKPLSITTFKTFCNKCGLE